MVRSGLSILDALTLVSSQTQNPVFKYAIEDIIANINQGNSLSVSIRQQPKYFDEVFCNMIEAGEISGKLDSFLDRIVEGQERMQTIRKGIKSALFLSCDFGGGDTIDYIRHADQSGTDLY